MRLLTLDPAVGVGWDGTPVKRTIDDWKWSDDGLSLRLHLRPGIVFHDGTQLTNKIAADILREALRPQFGIVTSTVSSVEPESSDQVVIKSTRPEGFLLSDISLADFALPGKKGVGTGPFMQVEGSAKPIVLRPFDKYRTGRPAIDEIQIAQYPNQRQAWAAMMRGEADVLHDVSVDSVDFVEAESTVQTFSFMKAYYHALVFNLTLPLFAEKDVRRALNMAVDRTQVVNVSLRNHGLPATDPIWPFHFGRSAEQPTYKFDPGQAEALLDELGLKRGREHAPTRMPSRFRFTCLVASDDQRLQRVALVLQKQLFNIGVDMDVELQPNTAVRSRVIRGEYEASLGEFGAMRSLNYVYAVWHSVPPGSMMDLHYSSADAALDRLRAALKSEEIKSSVAELQRAFYYDPPAVFLDWLQTARAVRKSVAVQNEPDRDVMGTIQQWRPASSQLTRR